MKKALLFTLILLACPKMSLIYANPSYSYCSDNDDCDYSPTNCGCAYISGKFFVTADYLYWKAHEDGLDFAIDGIGSGNGTLPSDQGEIYGLNWKANSGFRVGAGYLSSCECNDIYVNYTKYTGAAKGSVDRPFSVPVEANLWATFSAPDGGAVFFFGKSDWDLDFQTLDLEVGYTLCFGNCYRFRPFGGIEAVWTKDTNFISYDDRPDEDFFQTVHHKQDFCGAGPRVGINNNWKIFNCFSLFADTAVSIVWGHYNVERFDILNDVVVVNTSNEFSTLRPLFDLKLGIQWETCLWNCHRFFVKAAFEDQIFLKHNQFIRFMVGDFNNSFDIPRGNVFNINGDLSLYGLTLSAGIDF
ncbi:MAG: hypothetical protein S4CHLAM123_05820 [Chlamydiales bacterium]|nr:hypothetical protein [Chlamydiales bacterium]